MNHVALLETITQLVSPLVITHNLELWGIEIINTSQPIVKIFIEATYSPASFINNNTPVQPKTQGVTIEQCAILSRLIGLTMEVEKLFTTKWTLEVSSPGLERSFFNLEQLKKYIHQELEITLTTPHPLWPGRKKFQGTLSTVTNETFTLQLSLTQRKPTEPDVVCITWPQVQKAKLMYQLPKPNKKSGTMKRLIGGIV